MLQEASGLACTYEGCETGALENWDSPQLKASTLCSSVAPFDHTGHKEQSGFSSSRQLCPFLSSVLKRVEGQREEPRKALDSSHLGCWTPEKPRAPALSVWDKVTKSDKVIKFRGPDAREIHPTANGCGPGPNYSFNTAAAQQPIPSMVPHFVFLPRILLPLT